MSPKRNERAAPPPIGGEWEIRFLTSEAAKGWEELCSQAASNTRAAFDAMRTYPCPPSRTERQHRMKHGRRYGHVKGRALERWQLEVTGGGRIWYLVDQETRTVWLEYASARHPKTTE